MGTETELKLALDRAGLGRLRRHPLIRRLKVGRASTETLISVYFDTPGLLLRQRQVALRVRHIGTRRIQTVKTYGRCLAGAWARGEWETDIAGDHPDLSAITVPELAELVAGGRLKGLAPLFTTEIRRTTLILKDTDGIIELALDDGAVISAGARRDIVEAELELKAGTPALLFRTARALADDIPMRLTTVGKADRGYALAGGEAPVPVRAGGIALDPGLTTGGAFQAIAHACLAQILANQDCLTDAVTPEAIHQIRVGLRRLRSAMTLFRDVVGGPDLAALRPELRWLQGHLGPARDIDVFIAEILAPLATTLTDEPGFAALAADVAAERQASYAVARQVLDLPRYTRLMLDLALWIEDGAWRTATDEERSARRMRPIGPVAQDILRSRDRRACRSLRHLRRLDPATRHLGRINIKKLRYAVEFFAALYPVQEMRRLIAALGTLQDRLGLLNDIAVARASLLRRATESADPARLWAAGLVAGWHTARVDGLLDEAVADLDRFRQRTRPWRED